MLRICGRAEWLLMKRKPREITADRFTSSETSEEIKDRRSFVAFVLEVPQ